MKKKPDVIGFLNKINKRTLKSSVKYYEAYVKRLDKLKFDKKIIYSEKELPYSKNKIKTAIKRLLFYGDAQGWGLDHEHRKLLDKIFPLIANFQKHKTTTFLKSSPEIKAIYLKEFLNITDAVRLAKETHPELSKKIKKLNEKKN